MRAEDANAILVTRKLLGLYSLGGIPFGEIAFRDNVADAKKSMAGKIGRIQGTVHPAPKPSAKQPMPAKGRKVEAKPSAE